MVMQRVSLGGNILYVGTPAGGREIASVRS